MSESDFDGVINTCDDSATAPRRLQVPSRWRALAQSNENAAAILHASGASAEVVATFTAASAEANGVAAALDELAKAKKTP